MQDKPIEIKSVPLPPLPEDAEICSCERPILIKAKDERCKCRRCDKYFSPEKGSKVIQWQENQRKNALKQQRNELCHCHSGKKFKKCCINVPSWERQGIAWRDAMPLREIGSE